MAGERSAVINVERLATMGPGENAAFHASIPRSRTLLSRYLEATNDFIGELTT